MKRFTLLMVAALCCLTSRAGGLTVNDLVGVYSVKATGAEYITDYSTATDMSSKSYNVEITKNEDGTMTINNLLGFGSQLIGTLDSREKTITIAPSTVALYYTFASSSSATESVVAEISGSSDSWKISFFDFDAWYGEYGYIQSGSEIALTKTVITLDWSIEGSLILSDTSTEPSVNYCSTRATLCKYSGAAGYDYSIKLSYDYANPAEIRFKLTGAEITSYDNGWSPDGYGSYFYYVYPDNYYMYLSTYTGYTSFAGDKDGGEIYIWANDYSSETDEDGKYKKIHSGWLTFSWGTKDGISTPTIDMASDAAPIYNLVGAKVEKPTAGIYIQNGKKFIIK